MDMPRISFLVFFFNETSDSSLNDFVPYGKFYLLLTFMKNLQFRFYKNIKMVWNYNLGSNKKGKTWNLVLCSFFSKILCFWFGESNLVMD